MHYFKELETISNSKSSIKKCLHEPSKREVLIKFLSIPKRSQGKEKTCKMKNLIDEINALQKMNNSSHIVQIYGLCVLSEDHKYAQICMEPMDMSLEVMHRRFVEHFGFIPENLLVRIIVCLVDALKECHQNNVLHGDLHQSNILLNYKGDVKLCDFKVSTILTGSENDESKAMLRYIDNLADMLLELIGEQEATSLSWKRRNKVEPRSVSEGKFQSGNPQESSIIKEFINACYGSTKIYQSLMETGLYVNYCKISTQNDIEKILNEYKFCFVD
jgi:serine/threonine protein kinase